MRQFLCHKRCIPASSGESLAGNYPPSKMPPASCPLPESASAPSVLRRLSVTASPTGRKMPHGISVSAPSGRRTSGTPAGAAPEACSFPYRTGGLPPLFPESHFSPAPRLCCQTLYTTNRSPSPFLSNSQIPGRLLSDSGNRLNPPVSVLSEGQSHMAWNRCPRRRPSPHTVRLRRPLRLRTG